MNPKYPVYIISKGRWESRLTVKALEKMQVPFKIVIEPQEFSEYSQVVSKSKIITTPFKNLGQGSIPVRNFVWEHALKLGAKRHWIMDDNIRAFYRANYNARHYVASGTILKCAEDFTDRYENVGMSGLNYKMFLPDGSNLGPYTLNTRIYSCILIRNNLKHRWRGRYNEDTDLSIRVLKDGMCTILFNAFLADKIATMRMTGGNTDELYKEDGRLQMAKSLQEQHPDIVSITHKFQRWQHQVDYRGFTQKLIRKKGIIVQNRVNNYGMELVGRV